MNHADIIKWSKRLTLIGAILPILVFLGFAGAIGYIDFNRYKPQIEAEVKQQTGHEFEIEGAIEMSVFPLAVTVGQVSLKNAAEFAGEPELGNLLSAKQVHAELSVWDLFLNKRFSIMGVELVEPELTLIRNAQGVNWHSLSSALKPLSDEVQQAEGKRPHLRYASASQADRLAFLKVVQGEAAPEAKVTVEATESSATSEAENLVDSNEVTPDTPLWRFESLVIKNGSVNYLDRVHGQHATLSKLNLMAFDVTLGQPFQVRSDFAYRSTWEQRDYDFDLTASLQVSPDFGLWQVRDWQGVFKLRLPKEKAVPEMRMVTEGESFSLNLPEDRIQASSVRLKALGSEVVTSFSGRYGDQADLYGVLEAKGINVQNWGRHVGANMPDFVNKKALTEVKGQFNWELADGRLNVRDIRLTWDRSTLTGELWRQSDPEPKYAFDFEIDTLNLDDYRARYLDEQISPAVAGQPDAAGQKSPASPPAQTATASEAPTYLPLAVPISTLRSLQADGQLRIDQLTAWDLAAESVEMKLATAQGRLKLAPMNMAFYGGRLESAFQVDVNGETPAYAWQGKLQGIDAGAFLLAGWQARPLDGTLSAMFDLTTRGSHAEALRFNLNGPVQARVDQGHFYGVSLERLLAGEAVSKNDKTPFQSLTLQGSIEDGVAGLQPLAVVSRRFEAQGRASVDLNRLQLDTRLNLQVTEPPKSLDRLKGMKIPVRCRGALDEPVWSVNLKALLSRPDNRQRLLNQLETLISG